MTEAEPKIRTLDRAVINQIAAGEVVERPASVVKELLENAMDAGARRIRVEASGGGRELVCVVDDGCGMTPEEARLCLKRHATSKLRTIEDLRSIRTMGFRGEALPSIASVSHLTLLTRPARSDVGLRLTLEGGQTVGQEPQGCRAGTRVEVARLFFNTPARLKFLKSTATEAAHITDIVTRLALSEPGVHLSLVQDGRTILEAPPCAGRLERAMTVLGRQGDSLVKATLEEPGLRVEVCLTPPDRALRTTRLVILKANGRTIRDRALVQAVVSGYGALLEKGTYPVAVVHLDLDPSTLDVNVHPQKTEVRFEEPRRVFAAVRRCVQDLLARSPWLPGLRPDSRTYSVAAPREGYEEHRRRVREAVLLFRARPETDGAAEVRPAYLPDGAGALQPGVNPPAAVGLSGGTSEGARCGFFSSLRFVGQVMGTFLVCESADEMVLLDQHAAHERVTFEDLRRAARERGVRSQRLLLPVTVLLQPHLAAMAQEQGPALEHLGLELEPFGGDTWTVRAVPAALPAVDPEVLVQEVLEELARWGCQGALQARLEAVLARMACHGSVRAHRLLDEREVHALLRDLDRVDFGAACPHGRPVMLRLSRAELERRLGRSTSSPSPAAAGRGP